MARPLSPKLTPAVQEEICKWIRAGSFRETACAAAGIPSRTLRDWITKAKRDREQGIRSRYTDLEDALEEASEKFLAVGLAKIVKSGEKDWKALAWVLERTHSAKLSTKQTIEHETGGTLAELTLLAFGPRPNGDEDR
jgi:hypothetical protein